MEELGPGPRYEDPVPLTDLTPGIRSASSSVGAYLVPEGLQTDEPKTSSPLAEGQYPRWPRGPFQGEAEGRKPPPDRRSVTPTLGPSYRLLHVGPNGLCSIWAYLDSN